MQDGGAAGQAEIFPRKLVIINAHAGCRLGMSEEHQVFEGKLEIILLCIYMSCI